MSTLCPASISATDLNGDGRPDLVVANAYSDSVAVLLNTTAPGAAVASFAALTSFSTPAFPTFASAADVNGDGRPDLLVANNTAGSVSVLINITAAGATAPAFASPVSFAANRADFLATADVNGDGRPDLLVAGFQTSTVSVLLNTTPTSAATSRFAQQQGFGTGRSPTSVTAADINGDGRPDVVTADYNSGSVSVLLDTTAAGSALSTFAAKQSFATAGDNPSAVVTADINGDGRPDVLVSNFFSSTVSVLLNITAPGAATASLAATQIFDTDFLASSVTAFDINGDGRPDLVATNSIAYSGTVNVWINTTTPGAAIASFGTRQSFATNGFPRSVAAADINGDGRPDLLVNDYGGVSVLINSIVPGAAIASFATRQGFAAGPAACCSVRAADFNGDGRPDLLLANYDSNLVSVLLNTTAPGAAIPTFSAAQSFAVGPRPRSASAADVNGDGRPDLLVANESSQTNSTVSVLLNTTAPGSLVPSFAVQKTYPVGLLPDAVSSADINGDGLPDLLVGNFSSDNVSVLLNTLYSARLVDGFAVGTIYPAGSSRSLSISDVTLSEGDAGTRIARFTVKLSSPSTTPVTVTATTAEGSADSRDYVPRTSLITFAPGHTTKTFNVTVRGDALFEPDETFFANLSNATGAVIAKDQVVATIVNDDPVPTLSIRSEEGEINEPSSGRAIARFTIGLSAPSGTRVTVQASTVPGTADNGDYIGRSSLSFSSRATR